MKKIEKNTILKSGAVIITAAVLSIVGTQSVGAISVNTDLDARVNTSVTAQGYASSGAYRNDNDDRDNENEKDEKTSSTRATSTRGNTTSTEAKNKNASSTDMDDDNDNNDRDETTSESHRSIVATFVHSLLNVANRNGGIGAEVSAVARSQNESSSTTVSAMQKVEGRGSLRTFLFGSDYKSLSVIKSELATTTENIARLKAVLNQTTDVTIRAELSAQISALETEQARLDAYVKVYEDHFSLFGWFNRLFVK